MSAHSSDRREWNVTGGGDPEECIWTIPSHSSFSKSRVQFFSPFLVNSSILWIQLLNSFWSRWTSSRLLCPHRLLWSPILACGWSPGSRVGGDFGMVRSDCPGWDVYRYTLAPELEISTLDGWLLPWQTSRLFDSFLSTLWSDILWLDCPHFWRIWGWLLRWCSFTCSSSCLRFTSLLARWTA